MQVCPENRAEAKQLETEIAHLKRKLHMAVANYGPRHPVVHAIAEELDNPIARLMALHWNAQRRKCR